MPPVTLILVLLCLALAVAVVLLARRGGADAALLRLEAQSGAAAEALRAELAQLRREASEAAARSQETAARAAAALEASLHTRMDAFRAEQARHMAELVRALQELNASSLREHAALREGLGQRLHAMSGENAAHAEALREKVRLALDRLNTDNTARLEQMRATVDEKLHATLQSRLTESFGQVTDKLGLVHKGLGEMNELSAGVRDLGRLFANVKTRGGWAEVGLGRLLEQVLAPGQFVTNAVCRPGSGEMVEFAVRFPGHAGDTLLPIDAKFPRESWERLETAYEQTAAAPALEAAQKLFDAAIRTEARRIAGKYIHEPHTTPYAILFLPTEGLYAEVLRRDGLQSELHGQHRIMVAGPSTLYALLTSFQLGFRMLNLQRKGDEVWKVLGETKTEFGKFGDLMGKMEDQVGRVQKTIGDLGVRTRAIQRKLHDVAEAQPLPAAAVAASAFEGFVPALAANGEGEAL